MRLPDVQGDRSVSDVLVTADKDIRGVVYRSFNRFLAINILILDSSIIHSYNRYFFGIARLKPEDERHRSANPLTSRQSDSRERLKDATLPTALVANHDNCWQLNILFCNALGTDLVHCIQHRSNFFLECRFQSIQMITLQLVHDVQLGINAFHQERRNALLQALETIKKLFTARLRPTIAT